MDKRGYKGTNPTCHDFNPVAASHHNLPLLIGFSGGQIQYVDSIFKEINKLYNEEVRDFFLVICSTAACNFLRDQVVLYYLRGYV